jgi:hypothetical protein
MPGWEQWVELADRALYFVKHRGRNGWGAFRVPPGTEAAQIMQVLAEDPEELIASGRVEFVGSAGVVAAVKKVLT